MTIITNFYTVDNQIGANLNQPETVSVTSDPSVPGARAVLGDICQGIGGSQWVFVQASTTVTGFNVVAIDATFKANNALGVASNGASANKTLGIAEFQATLANAGDYFWAQVAGRGGTAVNVQSTAAAGVKMYISSSSPGSITTTVNSTVTNVAINNVFVVNALTSATAAVEVVFTYMQASV